MNKTIVREKGLVGTFYRSGNPTSAILLLGGASGGLREEWAEQLAKEGFATLALAYFAAESLPPTLCQIPLEYFEKAIQFLSDKVEKIGCWGISRGAEVSLLLGTLFPKQIGAIAAHVPPSVVFSALDEERSPSWTYQGKAFSPSAPFEYGETSTGDNEQSAIASTPSFLRSMEDQKAFAAAAIPVEKIECPLLLISAQDDQIWPSSVFAEQIVNRLAAHHSSILWNHLSYPGVGHAPYKGTRGYHPIMKRWFVFGGNPADNAFAAKDWWDQTVRFFKEKL